MRELSLVVMAIYTMMELFIAAVSVDTKKKPCESCTDTIPDILDSLIAKRVDSAAVVTNKQLDSIGATRDSLVVELKAVIRERKKKLQLGDSTGWITDSFRMADGRTQYWSWFFYRYPDGTYKFSHKKVQIK